MGRRFDSLAASIFVREKLSLRARLGCSTDSMLVSQLVHRLTCFNALEVSGAHSVIGCHGRAFSPLSHLPLIWATLPTRLFLFKDV